jgi:hypothetical protein
MEPMKVAGRGLRRAQSSRSRSATKVSQPAYFRRPLGSPRQQIAEPRSSMCQCPIGWKVDKPGVLPPVQIAGCSSRRDSATRWERLGERIGLAARIVDAMRRALGKFSFHSGASPYQRIGLTTEIAATTRAALVKLSFRSGASPHHLWRPYRARSFKRAYPGLKPWAKSCCPFGAN